MEIKKLKNLLFEFGDNVSFEHDLKRKNWFNIGGKAKIYFKPDTLQDLIEFLKLSKNEENFFVIGAGSNVLFKDEIYQGVIIKLGTSHI